MILPFIPLFIQYNHIFLGSHQPLLYIEGHFQVDRGFFDVVVEVNQAAGVYLQVRIGCLEFVIGKVCEFVFNEFYTLLDAVKVDCEFLFLFTLFEELKARIEC